MCANLSDAWNQQRWLVGCKGDVANDAPLLARLSIKPTRAWDLRNTPILNLRQHEVVRYHLISYDFMPIAKILTVWFATFLVLLHRFFIPDGPISFLCFSPQICLMSPTNQGTLSTMAYANLLMALLRSSCQNTSLLTTVSSSPTAILIRTISYSGSTAWVELDKVVLLDTDVSVKRKQTNLERLPVVFEYKNPNNPIQPRLIWQLPENILPLLKRTPTGIPVRLL